MKTSRLWKLIRTFDKKEIKELRKFVASPFFNQREDVVLLFEELIKCIQVKKITPTKEYLFSAIYPKEKFDVQQMHLISSLLYKTLEQFLAYNELHENQVKVKIHLAAAYRKRRLEDHFERTIEEAQVLHKKDEMQNAEHYEMEYQIMLEEYDFQHAIQRMEDYKLQEISSNMDLSFVAKKLRQSCLLLSHQVVFKREYDFGLLEKIMEYLDNNTILETPAIMTYYYCYKVLKDKKEEDFLAFKDIISKNNKLFPATEAKDLYLFALNFCIKKLNELDENYARIGLKLYQEMIDNNLLIENHIISRFAFRNIVSMGIFIKEFDWVERFIKEYTPFLEVNYRESMPNLSLGRLHYERGELDKAMGLLQRADYTDLLLSLSAKTILMKIYYELDEFDLLSAHLAALKAFIGRNKDTLGYHNQNYTSIIYLTKKMIEINFNDKKELEQLITEINNEKVLTERKWMLKMLSRY
jgi:hypothetical protein